MDVCRPRDDGNCPLMGVVHEIPTNFLGDDGMARREAGTVALRYFA